MSRRIPIPIVALTVAAIVLAVFAFRDEPRGRESRKPKLREPNVRQMARISAAEEWASEGKSAVPELLAALVDHDSTVRVAGAFGLARIGPDAADAIPVLIRGLKDPVPAVRYHYIFALAEIQTNKSELCSIIAPYLSNDASVVRQVTAECLARAGRFALPTVTQVLREASLAEARCEAIGLLLKIGDGPVRTAQTIRDALLDRPGDETVSKAGLLAALRLDAATAAEVESALRSEDVELVLAGIGHDPTAVDRSRRLDLILGLLDHANTEVRRAVRASIRWGSDKPLEVVPRLHELLKRAPAAEAHEVAMMLHEMDGQSAEAIACLKEAVLHLDSGPAVSVASVLRRLPEEEIADVIEKLGTAARHGTREERSKTLWILPAFGSHARRALDSIILALHDDDRGISYAAANVLQSLGSEAAPAVPHLVRRLESDLIAVKKTGATVMIAALGRIGPAAEPAVPLLQELAALSEPIPGTGRSQIDDAIRREAALALCRIGIRTPEVIEFMLQAARSEIPDPEALAAIPRLGVSPEVAVPTLTAALTSKNFGIRGAACSALAEYGAGAAPAVPQLIEELQVGNEWLAPVNALGRIGPPASDALPALLDMIPTRRIGISQPLAICEMSPVAAAQWYRTESQRPGEWELQRQKIIWDAIESIAPDSVSKWGRDLSAWPAREHP